ncbi:MAG: hypothetical protein J6N52_12525 [Clostridia bacterium]|nr:hypothetical protein [Clostridia bacterium]
MLKKMLSALLAAAMLVSFAAGTALAVCEGHAKEETISMTTKINGIDYIDHLGLFVAWGGNSNSILTSADGLNWENRVSYGMTMEFDRFEYGGSDADGWIGIGHYAQRNGNLLECTDEFFYEPVHPCYAQVKTETGYNPIVIRGQITYDSYTGFFYAGAHEIKVNEDLSYNTYRAGIYRTKGKIETLDNIYVMSSDKETKINEYGCFDAMVWEKVDTSYAGKDWNVYANIPAGSTTEADSALTVDVSVYGIIEADGKGHIAFTQGSETTATKAVINNNTYADLGTACSTIVMADFTGEEPRWTACYNGWGKRQIYSISYDQQGGLIPSAQWGNLNQRVIYRVDFEKALAGVANIQNHECFKTNTNTTADDALLATGAYVSKINNIGLYYVPVTLGGKSYMLAVPNTGGKVGQSVIVDRNGKTYSYNDILVWETGTTTGFTPFIGNDSVLETIFGNSYTNTSGFKGIAGAAYSPDKQILVVAGKEGSAAAPAAIHMFDLSEVGAVNTETEKAYLSVNGQGIADADSRFVYPVDRSSAYKGAAKAHKRHQHDALTFKDTSYTVLPGQKLKLRFTADVLNTYDNGSFKPWKGGICELLAEEVPIRILSADAEAADILDVDTYMESEQFNDIEIYGEALPGTYKMRVKAAVPGTATRFTVSDITVTIPEPEVIIINGETVKAGFGNAITGLTNGANTVKINYNKIADKKYDNINIFAAVYKDERLTDVCVEPKTVEAGAQFPGAEFVLNIDPSETEINRYEVKVFYWNAELMQPL